MKNLSCYLCVVLALLLMACTETDGLIKSFEPTTVQSASEFYPQLEVDPEHPYTCVVRWWTTEILYYVGVKTREEAWYMSNEEKLVLIDQLSEIFADESEDSPLNQRLSSLYAHMPTAIHNYPGMNFTDDNKYNIMIDSDDPDLSCKLQAMYYKEFGRPNNGLDNSDIDAVAVNYEEETSTDNGTPVYRSAQYKLQKKWNKNTVRYRCSKALKSTEKAHLKNAMTTWKTASNDKITFKEIPNSGWNMTTWALGLNYHSFVDTKTGKNYAGLSTLGMVPWAILYFNTSAQYPRTYLHELGHTLGLIHEHQRPDRDNYIKVIKSNIPSGWNDQYRKYLSSSVNVFGTFDFSSIMLYDSMHDNKVVMQKKDDSSTWTSPNQLSTKDKESIRQIYK